jgi:hypothetical protein
MLSGCVFCAYLYVRMCACVRFRNEHICLEQMILRSQGRMVVGYCE